MKLLSFNPNVGQTDLTDPKVITLVIENPTWYWQFSNYVYNGFPDHLGYCTLTSGEKKLDLSDNALFISNPWDLDVNSKANLNALYKLLKKSYFEELNNSVEKIEEILEKNCQEIRLDFDAALSINGGIRVDDIFKIGGMQFSENDGSFLERLTSYISIAKELRGISLVFINHLRDFLTKEECKELIKELQYRGISLVDIETHEPIYSFDNQIKFIIDHDLCILN